MHWVLFDATREGTSENCLAIVNMLRYCTNPSVIERFALLALVIGVDGIVIDACEQ